MSKKSRGWWSDLPESNNKIHHIKDEYAWAYDDDSSNSDELDESYGSDDYTSSRPWGLDNDGY